MAKKKKKSKEELKAQLDLALSKEYFDNTELREGEHKDLKSQRQEDVCESWNEYHNADDPKMVSKNGVVYTPYQGVDFIINSVAYLLKKEFGKEMNDDEVEIIEPFAGTGIFGARLADLGYDVDNLTCLEIDPDSVEVANTNISVSAGKPYSGCYQVDTFELYNKELPGHGNPSSSSNNEF